MFNHSYLQSIFEKEVSKIAMVMSMKTKGIPSKSAETNRTLPRLIRLLFVCQSTLFFIIMAASHYRINNSETHCKLSTLQVATILVAMTPKILKLATWFVKKVSLNQKNWSPNGDQAKTLTLMVDYKPHFQLFFPNWSDFISDVRASVCSYILAVICRKLFFAVLWTRYLKEVL